MLDKLLNFIAIELVFLSEFVDFGLIVLIDDNHSVKLAFILDIYLIELFLI